MASSAVSIDIERLAQGIRDGDRTLLSRAITLVESKRTDHCAAAAALTQALVQSTGNAVRVGITGSPGVGKSTTIDSLGSMLTRQGHKVAVLAVDPSSRRTGGSILADKTRMARLAIDPDAFIRPSPSSGTLGGVAAKTRETMLLCEAAGFDTILVETVGVGQTEIALRALVDFFLLLLLPGAGDELQGIKKGIVEMADLVAINKADGENRLRAELARQDQSAALHYLQPATSEWPTEVLLCAGLTGEGIPEIWERVEKFYAKLEPKGVIARRRQEQSLTWLNDLILDKLKLKFYRDVRVKAHLPVIQQALLRGEITAVRAAEALLAAHAETPPGSTGTEN